MASEIVSTDRPGRPAKAKDVLIAVLALCLCFCLVALIHETRRHQEISKLYSEQVQKLQNLQRATDQSIAAAEQNKMQSDRALRRAQLAMKAGYEAQGIAARLRQAGSKAGAQSR